MEKQTVGRSMKLCVCGPPGIGKSALLAKLMLALNKEYEFIAVDDPDEHALIVVKKEVEVCPECPSR